MRNAFVLLALAFCPLVVLQVEASGGNLDPCRVNSDCAKNRTCRVLKLDVGEAILQVFGSGFDLGKLITSITPACESKDNYCICLPSSNAAFKCPNSAPCLDSEVCTSDRYCISKVQSGFFQAARKCVSNSGCKSNQQCAKFVLNAGGFCLAERPPTTSIIGNGTETNSTNQNNDGSIIEEVCIAARYLAHLSPTELLYKKHFSSRVLCDAFGSCATAGHIVRYRGKAMMMKTYCAHVGGCSPRVMKVNSPRYRRALDVPSDTPDLSFTAFAARHGTKAEEYILGTAIRMGF
ncbi:hypothetical protein FGB62_25g053 [Gracilaria domingensis]|nr:hypothetical protein FGB62_25g053 [Gracilaria domingensis]